MTRETKQSTKRMTKHLTKKKNQHLWKNSNDKKPKVFKHNPQELKGILKKEPKHEKNDELSPEKSASIAGEQVESPKLKKNKKSRESKSLKRKTVSVDDSANKKPKLCDMKKKARKLVRKQSDSKKFEVGCSLKKLWEEFRREDCGLERKNQLLKQVCDLLKGRVKEFTFAHDTVRVLESVLANGAETHRTLLFEELKDEIIPLSKAKYGKFFLLKMLRYGSKLQKNTIIKAFHGQVISLIRHKEAAEVVEVAFNECANALQRFELAQEFYGADYKFFKTSDVKSLGQILEEKPESKSLVIENMKSELLKVLEKSVVKHSIVHYVLLQFMMHCDHTTRSEIIESLRPVVPEILHTKDGSRVAMHCIWYGTVKDRKAIMKAMSMFVPKIAMEEHGHMVLLTLFDCVDDTRALEKYIIKELIKKLLELSQNVHGKKVLIYLLNPRDPHYIHPDVINILKIGDNNENSKKDPVLRSSELKQVVAEPLLQLIISNISTLYKDNSFCLFTLIILNHVVGDRKAAFTCIADLAKVPYTSENKNIHVIEHAGSSFLFKQLIMNDSNEAKSESTSPTVSFSQVLIDVVPGDVMKSWLECNRGAFLLVSLLETNIPAVILKVKSELTGCKKLLSKKNFKGAEILLKKLRE